MNEIKPGLIEDTLIGLVITPNLKAYEYLLYAIRETVKDPCKIRPMMGLYAEIAEKHNDTPSRVERAMRSAIEKAYTRCPLEVLESTLGPATNTLKGHLTNSQFISVIADRCKRGVIIG